MSRIGIVLSFFILMLNFFSANAAQNREAAVPPELKPWIPWVNKNLDFLDCPIVNGGELLKEEDHICAWPGRLDFKISRTRAEVEQNWTLYQKDWVPLPGDQTSWPLLVTVNGQKSLVQKRGGHPFVLVKKGVAKIQAYYKWEQQPEKFYIPEIVGGLNLTLNGIKVHAPNIENNYVLLGESSRNSQLNPQQEKDALNLRVYRLIRDDHPIQMITRLQLDISGRVRDINLGTVLLDSFRHIAINSPIPAYLNAKRELIVQAKPGYWTLHIESFVEPSVKQLSFSNSNELWPAQEVWSFRNNSEIRVATLSGLPVIDPESAKLPGEWRQYPSFLFEQSNTAIIDEKVRGLPEDASNQMTLDRSIWLSFDGDKWRFDDRIRGQMRKDWRLSMQTPYRLEHAAEQGAPLLITQLSDNDTGVELRNPALSVSANGEIDPVNELQVSGWDDDFDAVNWSLNLPPAHRLIAAQGAESSNSWLQQWNLWNVFWVLLLTVIGFRFGNVKIAAVTLVTLVLMFHETGAPIVSLSSLLIAYVIYRTSKLVKGVLGKLTTGYFYLSLLSFVIFSGIFFIGQVRTLIHPQLEHSSPLRNSFSSAIHYAAESESIARLEDSAMIQPEKSFAETEKVKITGSRIHRPLERYQKNTVIQTGSGKPDWQWNQYRLSWNSPVSQEQSVNLWIASPWLMTLWRLAIIGGLIGLLALIGLSVTQRRFQWQSLKNYLGMALIFLLPVLSQPVAAEIPDQQTLQELKQWLHQPAECSPNCVTISGVRILNNELNGRESLTLEMQVDAFEKVAFPIPASRHWVVQSIKIDGRPQSWLIYKSKQRWLNITKGRHKVELTGVLSGATSFNLQFPLVPQNIQNLSDSWELEGLINGNLLSDSIGFNKKASAIAASAESGQVNGADPVEQTLAIQPMVNVVRVIWFDTDWRMTTQVQRLAPQKGDINIELPVLPFERVTSADFTPRNGIIKVQIPAGEYHVSWNASLEQNSPINLTAQNSPFYVEEWVLHAAHQWRIEMHGVPQVRPQSIESIDNWSFRYLPRAGESLSVEISRPQPVEGFSQTFDEIQLNVVPGEQQRKLYLNARYRASRGGQSTIHVGAGEQLEASVDGRKEYLQIQDGVINYNVSPGEHTLDFNWRESTPMGFKASLPQIDLNAPMSNLRIQWQVPSDRWVLWTQGPTIGPAIIYWGELLAFLILAGVVWRTRCLPITPISWLLLGLGLSTQSWVLLVVITLWFVVMGLHRKFVHRQSATLFNVVQIMLSVFSVMILLALVSSIPLSLLSSPDMGITGNRSTGNMLYWYADAALNKTPAIAVYSLPLWVYKAVMLAWALWLAFALVRWVRWGWQCLTQDGYWRESPQQSASSESVQADQDSAHVDESRDDVTLSGKSSGSGNTSDNDNNEPSGR